MKTDTSKRIIEYIRQNSQVSPKDLYNYLEISPRAIFKQIKNLCDKKLIQKIGLPPKVYYSLAVQETATKQDQIPENITSLINAHFYYISPIGEEKIGAKGFEAWCAKQNLLVSKTAEEYALTLAKYNQYKKNNLIDGMHKISSSLKNIALDHLFYLDFYAIERFGKTKLGQLLLLAKSSQNKKQINALIKIIEPSIKDLIRQFNIDAVGFIPPTVKREVQFMNELKKNCHITKPILSIIKPKSNIMIAQKSLSKLQDRIDNARQTIIVENQNSFNNILLIDDAVGSGATLNETAAQIKKKKLAQGKIIGLAIVGSFKGFDVISEV